MGVFGVEVERTEGVVVGLQRAGWLAAVCLLTFSAPGPSVVGRSDELPVHLRQPPGGKEAEAAASAAARLLPYAPPGPPRFTSTFDQLTVAS